MSIGDRVLLSSGLVLYTWLVFVLWRRRVYGRFPVFFSYAIYGALASAARLLVSGHYSIYFYVYWSTELGFLLLGIAALHETFQLVFGGFYLLRRFRWFYYGSLVLFLTVSVVNSIFNRPVNTHPLIASILDLGTAINCIQAAIFGLFYICAKLLNVSFRRYPFAIVLGFGISAIGTLIPYAIRSIFGKSFENFVVYAPSVAYYIRLGIWLSAFLRREPADDEPASPLSPEQMTDEVRQYTRVMKGVFGKSNES